MRLAVFTAWPAARQSRLHCDSGATLYHIASMLASDVSARRTRACADEWFQIVTTCQTGVRPGLIS